MQKTIENKEAAFRFLKLNKKASAKYAHNTNKLYCCRVWFKNEEAVEVREFLDTIRGNASQWVSSKFVRKAILNEIRKYKAS